MAGKWRKSSRSGANQGSCVETRANGPRFQVRDSKLGEASPILDLTGTDFTGLLASVKR